jgi:RNA polymerase sigma-70 factor (ECF subfamily)
VTESRNPTARDSSCFETLLDEHRGIVRRITYNYCRSGEERDDLAQEIGLQLWRAWPGYDPGRRFSTWMYRVALNTAISFARARQSRQRGVVTLDESDLAASAAAPPAEERDERLERLHRHLRGLPELDRALVLLWLEDRSYREIGEVLGISETNVGTKLNRLKQTMRRDLEAT